jgi:beta-galactosidase
MHFPNHCYEEIKCRSPSNFGAGLANSADLAVSVLPGGSEVLGSNGEGDVATSTDGLFTRLTAKHAQHSDIHVAAELVGDARPPRPISKGRQGVAEAPSDDDFGRAAVWRLKLPPSIDPFRDLLLRVRYVGDVARLYLDGRLTVHAGG